VLSESIEGGGGSEYRKCGDGGDWFVVIFWVGIMDAEVSVLLRKVLLDC